MTCACVCVCVWVCLCVCVWLFVHIHVSYSQPIEALEQDSFCGLVDLSSGRPTVATSTRRAPEFPWKRIPASQRSGCSFQRFTDFRNSGKWYSIHVFFTAHMGGGYFSLVIFACVLYFHVILCVTLSYSSWSKVKVRVIFVNYT